jgi:hypothetical protein
MRKWLFARIVIGGKFIAVLNAQLLQDFNPAEPLKNVTNLRLRVKGCMPYVSDAIELV